MKTQIIRRISLAVIASLIAFSNNSGNKLYSSVNVDLGIVDIQITYSFSSFNLAKDFKSISCHFCIAAIEHNSPAIAEPNGDHEFHSFNLKHHDKRSFWKTIVNKILSAVYYLVVVVTFLPYKILS